MNFLVVGAGLTGGTIARILADAGHRCVVFEQESFVAGNCHTERDSKTGILMHCFGPHTLHSDNQQVWSFLERFAQIYPFRHRKQAWIRGEIYPFPINLTAINKLFGTDFDSEEAERHIAMQAAPYAKAQPENFEEAALASVGPILYEAYYKGYTKKQWGRSPTDLPPFIFRRLPIHLNDDTNVFHHARLGQPVGGYTLMVEQMLDHPNITLKRDTAFDHTTDRSSYDHMFYSGAIDRYFNWSLGMLPYRTLEFKHEHREGTFQSCGSVNYCDEDIPYTRVAEHKHFWPWEQHENTVITYEFPRELQLGDKPYYPIRLTEGNQMFERYVQKARIEHGVSFVGRLGAYRYLDMDKAIEEAMAAAKRTLECIQSGEKTPSFFCLPETTE